MDKEIDVLARFQKFAAANEISVPPTVMEPSNYDPVPGYEPARIATWVNGTGDIYAISLKFLAALSDGDGGWTSTIQMLRRHFGLPEYLKISWKNFSNPEKEKVRPPNESAVGNEIPGRPGEFNISDDCPPFLPDRLVYTSPNGQRFEFRAHMFTPYWKMLD